MCQSYLRPLNNIRFDGRPIRFFGAGNGYGDVYSAISEKWQPISAALLMPARMVQRQPMYDRRRIPGPRPERNRSLVSPPRQLLATAPL